MTRVAAAERSSTEDPALPLVRRAREGDAAAFDALARTHIDRAYRLAVAILRSEVDAADAVQDAFLAAWRQLPSLRDPGRFDAWLDRIVVNACRMSLRHGRVVRLREIDLDDPPGNGGAAGATPGPEQQVADVEIVRGALERLAADQRAILVLHHVEGRPVEEIAAVLGIPAGTVKWRLHAARTALQRAVEEALR